MKFKFLRICENLAAVREVIIFTPNEGSKWLEIRMKTDHFNTSCVCYTELLHCFPTAIIGTFLLPNLNFPFLFIRNI